MTTLCFQGGMGELGKQRTQIGKGKEAR